MLRHRKSYLIPILYGDFGNIHFSFLKFHIFGFYKCFQTFKDLRWSHYHNPVLLTLCDLFVETVFSIHFVVLKIQNLWKLNNLTFENCC